MNQNEQDLIVAFSEYCEDLLAVCERREELPDEVDAELAAKAEHLYAGMLSRVECVKRELKTQELKDELLLAVANAALFGTCASLMEKYARGGNRRRAGRRSARKTGETPYPKSQELVKKLAKGEYSEDHRSWKYKAKEIVGRIAEAQFDENVPSEKTVIRWMKKSAK